ncbi:MAG TPA: hypothetical protein VGX49_05145, partial [Jatrophihabitans sp.]|nr:hypothetical protein [Jatrophihabitans sp.]
IVARRRGGIAEGQFRLGRWAWPVTIVAAAYLGLMLLNVVLPTGLASPRGYFNLDWITLLVMLAVTLVGVLVFVLAHPDRDVRQHLRDAAEPSGAERGHPRTSAN